MNDVEVWHYLQQGATMGPVSRPVMESMIRAGTLARDTLVWPGYGDWIAAGSSTLAPLFMGGGGFAPPPPPMPMVVPATKKDWLPQDKRMRLVVQILIALIGLYFIYSGIQQVRGGVDELSPGQNSSINFQACRGVSASAVECGYQNTGSVTRRLCMDVVVMCADGRHVASTCSDKMKPGEGSTKLVDNFKPVINANMSCSGMTYENMKAKG